MKKRYVILILLVCYIFSFISVQALDENQERISDADIHPDIPIEEAIPGDVTPTPTCNSDLCRTFSYNLPIIVNTALAKVNLVDDSKVAEQHQLLLAELQTEHFQLLDKVSNDQITQQEFKTNNEQLIQSKTDEIKAISQIQQETPQTVDNSVLETQAKIENSIQTTQVQTGSDIPQESLQQTQDLQMNAAAAVQVGIGTNSETTTQEPSQDTLTKNEPGPPSQESSSDTTNPTTTEPTTQTTPDQVTPTSPDTTNPTTPSANDKSGTDSSTSSTPDTSSTSSADSAPAASGESIITSHTVREIKNENNLKTKVDRIKLLERKFRNNFKLDMKLKNINGQVIKEENSNIEDLSNGSVMVSFRFDDITFEERQEKFLKNAIYLARKYNITFDLAVIALPFDVKGSPKIFKLYEDNQDIFGFDAHGLTHENQLNTSHYGEFYDLTTKKNIPADIQDNHIKLMDDIFKRHGLDDATKIFIVPYSSGDENTINSAEKYGYKYMTQTTVPNHELIHKGKNLTISRDMVLIPLKVNLNDSDINDFKTEFNSLLDKNQSHIEIIMHEANFYQLDSIEKIIQETLKINKKKLIFTKIPRNFP